MIIEITKGHCLSITYDHLAHREVMQTTLWELPSEATILWLSQKRFESVRRKGEVVQAQWGKHSVAREMQLKNARAQQEAEVQRFLNGEKRAKLVPAEANVSILGLFFQRQWVNFCLYLKRNTGFPLTWKKNKRILHVSPILSGWRGRSSFISINMFSFVVWGFPLK